MTTNTGNGWLVVDRRWANAGSSVTIYLRIPPALATPIVGGCHCPYCKAHPEQVPTWDTLAVSEDHDHSWTVHMPDPPAARKS